MIDFNTTNIATSKRIFNRFIRGLDCPYGKIFRDGKIVPAIGHPRDEETLITPRIKDPENFTLEDVQKLCPNYDILIQARGIGVESANVIHSTLLSAGLDGVPGYPIPPKRRHLVELEGDEESVSHLLQIAEWMGIEVNRI